MVYATRSVCADPFLRRIGGEQEADIAIAGLARGLALFGEFFDGDFQLGGGQRGESGGL